VSILAQCGGGGIWFDLLHDESYECSNQTLLCAYFPNMVCLGNEYAASSLRFTSMAGRTGYTEQTSSTENFSDQSITTVVDYNYDPAVDYLLREQVTTRGQDRTDSITYTYPKDYSGNAIFDGMSNKNMVSSPIEVEAYVNGQKLGLKRTEYKAVGSQYFPDVVKNAKQNNALENRVAFNYRNGNVIESFIPKSTYSGNGSTSNTSANSLGSVTSYIWGYDNRYLIAKVDGATYAQIEALSAFSTNFTISENLSSTQLNALRGISGAQVSTYQYKPNIGITKMTDPKGYTMEYKYDPQNRLEYVIDQDGNVLSENQYNFKQ